MQSAALRVKQKILTEVGLSEARREVEKLARTATDARKRGVVEKRKAEVALPARRSSRCVWRRGVQ